MIVITASQLPLSQEKNDAFYNLMGSFKMVAHYNIPEVCFYFRDRLFRGNRIKKRSTENISAFDSPNLAPLVEDEIHMNVNWNIIMSKPKCKQEKFKVDFVRGFLIFF
jgi:lysophospholipase